MPLHRTPTAVSSRTSARRTFKWSKRGSARPIDSVRLVRADGRIAVSETLQPIRTSEDERVEAARENTRLFAIFLDEYHVTAGPAVARVRELLADLVDRNLGPGDLMLVVKPLDSLQNLRLTRDSSAVRASIAAFGGRKGDYTPRTAFEKTYIALDPPRIDAARAQIATSALTAMAVHLGMLNAGRKTIIAVSEGFARARRRADALPSIDSIIRSANRSGVSIYPIDPRAFQARAGTAASATVTDADDDVETMRALAAQTDGRAILTEQDAADGFQRMVSDASSYYLIAFQPAHPEANGRFHSVDVRVTRPGVALRTRTGYWSPLPEAPAPANPATTLATTMQRHVSTLIQTWFGQARAAEGSTRVQFVWEPAARVPGERILSAPPARVALKVLRADGTAMFRSDGRAGGLSAPRRERGEKRRCCRRSSKALPDACGCSCRSKTRRQRFSTRTSGTSSWRRFPLP